MLDSLRDSFHTWRFVVRLRASLRDPDGDWTARLKTTGREQVAQDYFYESDKLGMRFEINRIDDVDVVYVDRPFWLKIEHRPARWLARDVRALVGEDGKGKLRFLAARMRGGFADCVELADVDLLDLRRKTRACKRAVYVTKQGRNWQVYFADPKDAVMFKLAHV